MPEKLKKAERAAGSEEQGLSPWQAGFRQTPKEHGDTREAVKDAVGKLYINFPNIPSSKTRFGGFLLIASAFKSSSFFYCDLL